MLGRRYDRAYSSPLYVQPSVSHAQHLAIYTPRNQFIKIDIIFMKWMFTHLLHTRPTLYTPTYEKCEPAYVP